MKREDLQKELKEYKEIVQSSSCLIYKTNPTGQILFANKTWAETLEYSEEEALVLKVIQIIRKDQVPSFLEMMKIALSGKAICNFQTVFISKNAREIYVEGNVSGIIEDGKIKSLQGGFRDITSRKLTEQRLFEETALLNKSQEIAHIGGWKTDLKNNEITWSDEVFRIFGISKDAFAGTYESFLSFIHPNDKKRVKESFEKSIKDNLTANISYRIIRPSGEVRYLRATSNKIKNTKEETAFFYGLVTDITDFKLTENALSDQLAYSNILFEHSPDSMFLADLKGIFIDGNSTAEKLTGYKKEELIGKSFLKFGLIHLNQVPIALKQIQEVIRKKQTGSEELVLIRKDGSEIYVETSAHLVKIKGKNYILGSVRDITKRKEIEKDLIELSNRTNTILVAVPDILMEIDNKAVYKWGNQSGYDFFGSDVIGKKVDFYFEGIQQTLDKVKPLFKGSEELIFVKSWQRRRDGQKRLLAWWNKSIKDENGNPIGIIGSARDITEKHLSDLAKNDLNKRLLKAQEMAHLGFLDWEIKTNIVTLSDEVCKIYGIPDTDKVGILKIVQKIVHTDDRIEVENGLKAAVRGERKYNVDHRIIRPNGEVRWVNAQAELSNNQKVLFGMVMDITERKQSEEELLKTNKSLQKLSLNLQDEIEKERCSIALNLHDDLEQKLTALNMLLAIYSKNKILDPAEHLSKTEQMKVLLKDCLASLSSISSHLRPSVLDNLGLDAALKWFLEDTGTKTLLTVKSTFEKLDLDYSVVCASHIYRMVQESITNVLRHAKANRVNFHLKQQNKMLQISIHDNGCGISPRKLYNPQSFGIYGMRERAKFCGGSIEFLSKPKQGTQVLITLPIDKIKA